nr:hypothetical protein [Tanacetum cinerariifolium]
IEHMVPRSELELEKRRVAKWKRRADEQPSVLTATTRMSVHWKINWSQATAASGT